MLIIERQENESIDRALRRYRNKYRKTKVREELRERKTFTKPSVKRRKEILQAVYTNKKETD